MPWNDPITWQANDLVTASQLNEQLRDNQNYLRQRPLYTSSFSASGNSTNLTSYEYVTTAGNLGITVPILQTTAGLNLQYLLIITGTISTNPEGAFKIIHSIGGSNDTSLLIRNRTPLLGAQIPFCLIGVLTLAAHVQHVIRPKWAVDSSSVTMSAAQQWKMTLLEISVAS